MTIANISTTTENNQIISSKAIAKITSKRHADVIRDIRSMIESLKDDASMLHDINQGLTEYKDERNYTVEFTLSCFLAELLVTGYDAVRRAKVLKRLIELERAQYAKENFSITRQTSKDEYLPMTNAIAEAHEEIKPYHFSNEADLINRIVLGCTASKYLQFHDIPKTDAIRDYLNHAELDCIVSLQRANTVYIEDGIDFQERKEKLTSLYNRKHKQKIINEIHLLNA